MVEHSNVLHILTRIIMLIQHFHHSRCTDHHTKHSPQPIASYEKQASTVYRKRRMRVPKTPKTQYYLDELMLNKYEALHRAAVLVYHQMQVKGVVLSLPVSDEQQAVGGGLAQQASHLWCHHPSLLVPDLPFAQTLLQRPAEALEASSAEGTFSPVHTKT